ncbi:MAG: hypothetical protein P0111_14430 [Nitrospira sp.]|nr:hypothetical protein [Nitrospira sp.]
MDDTDSPVGLRNVLASYWRDVGLGLVLSLGVAFALYHLSGSLPAFVAHTDDFWFQADPEKVSQVMTWRDTRFHYGNRSRKHPLYPLFTFGPVYLIKHALSLDPTTAVRVFNAAVVSVWIAVFFSLLRVIGCRRPDAALFTMLASVSASSIFMFVIPETYGLGSLSLLCAFLLVALAECRPFAPGWYVAANALSLAVTTTNWMAGILALWVTYPWKRVLRLMLYSLCLVMVLWIIQKALIPSRSFFFPNVSSEVQWTLLPESGGAFHVARAAFLHSIVMPTIVAHSQHAAYVWVNGRQLLLGPRLTIQGSSAGSGSGWGLFAVGLWVGLLLLGVWAWVQLKAHARLRVMLGLTLLGQVMLHIPYGDETFLYGLHFMPFLILVTAAGTLTSARPVALALGALLLLAASMNNTIQFQRAISMAHDSYRQSQVQQESGSNSLPNNNQRP